MHLSRRTFLANLFVAPAIIKLAPIMPISPQPKRFMTLAEFATLTDNLSESIASFISDQYTDLLIYGTSFNRMTATGFERFDMSTGTWRKLNLNL